MKGHCKTCGEVTLWISKPLFDGFKKTGDRIVCSDCGAEQQAPAAPIMPAAASAPKKPLPSIFDESDRPAETKLADDGDSRHMCRHCRHYLVNAFTQRCALTLAEVKATDSCPQFAARA